MWMNDALNKYKTDVIIIDEASMVDQETLYRLLVALEHRTHIIFVGDHYQLPSVGAGNVLRELIGCGKIHVVRLEKIFRQEEASDIIKVAHRIKNGDSNLDMFSSDPKSDVFFIRDPDISKIEKYIIAMAEKFKKEKKGFQIITPRNQGPLSVDSLNELLQATLNPAAGYLKEIKFKHSIIRRGDRVMVIKNDYERDIYNGDIGKVTGIQKGCILLSIDDKTVEISVEEAEEKIKLAYAVTIHKAQGLEYPYVIIPFVRQHVNIMLQRNLLYTAITRAKKKVIMLGHGSAVERAINNATVIKRNTVFGERITWNLKKKENPSLQVSLQQQ
jgi:exodeoxyribonuclease V alpha subunit